jgi:hypothetical protein
LILPISVMGLKRRFDLLAMTQATTTSPVPALKPIDNVVEGSTTFRARWSPVHTARSGKLQVRFDAGC